MAEPFVFHFRRGEAGNPEQMYLADIRAECQLCGQPQVQRYYHSTPAHPVTIATLERLAEEITAKTEYECPNCGSPVGPQAAMATALTWAFPDDSGVLRGIVSTPAAPVQWQFEPGRRLDPQALPGWAPDSARPTHDQLSEQSIREAFERPVSVKAIVRRAFGEGAASAHLAPGMLWYRGTNDAPDTFLDSVVIALVDSVPGDLPTHRNPEGMPGSIHHWWPEGIDRDDVHVQVDLAAIDSIVERAFSVANLTWEKTEAGFAQIRTPRKQEYPRSVSRLAVAQRAVYTGMTPGDAARLTAEEIVGTLLGVW